MSGPDRLLTSATALAQAPTISHPQCYVHRPAEFGLSNSSTKAERTQWILQECELKSTVRLQEMSDTPHRLTADSALLPRAFRQNLRHLQRALISRSEDQRNGVRMHDSKNAELQLATFLSSTALGGKIIYLNVGESFFAQGDEALFVIYLQSGSAKLTVISKRGKEATIMLFKEGDFIGEEAVAGVVGLRIASATAVTACTAMKIDRKAMVRVLQDNNIFAEIFLKFVLLRGIRTQEDLVDQLFNSSEKRLARTLLLMAEFGKPGEPEMLIPPITQEALAEMIGTTRSRVSYFMNRFRELGYIEYNGRIHVNKSLLNVVLRDQLPEQRATRPTIVDPPRRPTARARSKKLVAKKLDRTQD